MYLHLGPPDRSLVPRDVQEASQVDFGAISDLSERLWKPKNTVKYKVFAIFHVAPQTSPRSSKSAPWKAQNDLQEAPGTPQEPPRQPEASQERPQSRLPSALGGQVGPNWHRKPSKGPSQAILDPQRAGFASSGGRLSYSFLLSESIGKAVLWAKLAQAYAQHRFTSLCNFYMWISTATDSRSRSTNTCMNS